MFKKHIVDLDWTTWDLNAEDPPHYPESGEPEDYILSGDHSESLAGRMGDVWELVIPITGTFNNGTFIGNGLEAIFLRRTIKVTFY